MFNDNYVVNECSSNVTDIDKDFCGLVGSFMLANGIDKIIIHIKRKKSCELGISVDVYPSVSVFKLRFFDDFNKACGFYFALNNFKIFKAFRDALNGNKISFRFD